MTEIEEQPIAKGESSGTPEPNVIPVEIPAPAPEPETPPVAETIVVSPQETPPPVIPQSQQPMNPARTFLRKALESIQFRKRAKLDKIMKLAHNKKFITNDDVQKLLRVSDASATRYLSLLVRQNRLTKTGIKATTRYEPILGSNGGN